MRIALLPKGGALRARVFQEFCLRYKRHLFLEFFMLFF